MAILKIIRKQYTNDGAILNLISYITNPLKTPSGIIGGKGVSLSNPAYCMDTNINIHKSEGKKAEHFVLSFSPKDDITVSVNDLYRIGYDICDYFSEYQVVFALHEPIYGANEYGNDFYHFHFVINTTNLYNGRKHTWSLFETNDLLNYVCAVLEKDAGFYGQLKLV